MSSTPKSRLGPYELGPRYKSTENVGRVFRARHAETGAPALVLQPTARQLDGEPVADWQLRLTSSQVPAFLALEVESAPAQADADEAGEELEAMLDDLARALGRTLHRPETLRHLRSPRRVIPQPTEPSLWRLPVLRTALAVVFAGAVVCTGGGGSLHGEGGSGLASSAELSALGQAALDAGFGEDAGDVTGAAFTGAMDFESRDFVLARPMPRKPFKTKTFTQKTPPCDSIIEEEHSGGCWVPHATPAPCPDKLYERGGKCFLPAVQAPPPPAAIFR